MEETIDLEPLSSSAHAALRLRITTDDVLSADAIDRPEAQTLHDSFGWGNVLVYAKELILAGHQDAANTILADLVAAKEYEISESNQAICELFWASASLSRPPTASWPAWNADKLAENTCQYDPAQLAFYDWASRFGSRTDREDLHSWRVSSDVEILTACARALCRPDPQGQLPSREALAEAAEVLDKLADVLPDKGAGAQQMDIPGYVRFALALHVADPERVQTTLEWLGRSEQKIGVEWDTLFLCPGLWDALRAGVSIKTYTGDEAERITSALCAALQTRSKQGKQGILAYETAMGLFARYAPAAWRALRRDLRDWVEGPEEICLPGLDDAGIAAVREKFGGWLDPELEELSRCHDGWLGGSFYDGGGFPGLAKFVARKFGNEAEQLISIIEPWDKDMEYVERSNEVGIVVSELVLWEGQEDAVVYMGEPMTGDSFKHYLVTAGVWKELGKVLGREVPEGQYGYGMYTLAVPDDGMEYIHSLKEWLARSVAELEQHSFMGRDAC